jgi:hypothetical protein
MTVYGLGQLLMIGAYLIARAHKDDGRHNRRQISGLDHAQQSFVTKDAVAQEQDAGNQPNYPRRNAYAPGAFLEVEMAYLRDISEYDECRTDPT